MFAKSWESMLPIILVSTWGSLSYTRVEWAVLLILLWRKFKVNFLVGKPSFYQELGNLCWPK